MMTHLGREAVGTVDIEHDGAATEGASQLLVARECLELSGERLVPHAPDVVRCERVARRRRDRERVPLEFDRYFLVVKRRDLSLCSDTLA